MDNTEFSLKLLTIVREIEKEKWVWNCTIQDVYSYILEETKSEKEEPKTISKDIYDEEWNQIWTYEELEHEQDLIDLQQEEYNKQQDLY